MKNFKSYFDFSKQEQSGIFYLLLLLVVLQFGFYAFHRFSTKGEDIFIPNKQEQLKIEALKKQDSLERTEKRVPFNPNYISDYKGYVLGMSPEEIDRLQAYRKKNLFINSAEEFQKVTKISDSLLAYLKPYFKFPKWKKKDKRPHKFKDLAIVPIKDLNACSVEELKSVSGIGEVLSLRIVKFRTALGGFLVDSQLLDVYGLKPEVAQRVFKKFKVQKIPEIKKINIQTASAAEISKLPYISKGMGYKMVRFRSGKDSITSLDDFSEIEGFPLEKIDKIKLYFKIK